MSPTTQLREKKLGQGMLVISFALALTSLTVFFDGWIKSQRNPNAEPGSTLLEDGSLEVALLRNRQGHYMAAGTINGWPVTFLLDTGATDVAVPAGVAGKIGLLYGAETRVITAAGIVPVFSTTISKLTLGSIELSGVSASISPSMRGDTILLGMSALKRLEFAQRENTLTLRQSGSQKE
ncbi:MAG: TIGR02281 family clan AA aspartic protease [Gammaproteobacteria bacterium]|nr:TIGR02281 family clan AA aspartic protease [Gammaproteobacteria bacterium]HBW83765.1 TIGR02281 family clan AA aspartic protease [Gammaproteobacteria bacterium]|tara:strand:- start:5543 stop:6082 length:540 start_codon:yes stop_codon:yes gene_type:complete